MLKRNYHKPCEHRNSYLIEARRYAGIYRCLDCGATYGCKIEKTLAEKIQDAIDRNVRKVKILWKRFTKEG